MFKISLWTEIHAYLLILHPRVVHTQGLTATAVQPLVLVWPEGSHVSGHIWALLTYRTSTWKLCLPTVYRLWISLTSYFYFKERVLLFKELCLETTILNYTWKCNNQHPDCGKLYGINDLVFSTNIFQGHMSIYSTFSPLFLFSLFLQAWVISSQSDLCHQHTDMLLFSPS